ncbi:DUF3179 domain-containing (seleno)protein [Salinivirga cyanobacteriivorans]
MRIFLLIFTVLILLSCEQDDANKSTNSKRDFYWRVDTTEMSGTSIRETFPVITMVNYTPASDIDLPESSRVLVTRQGGQVFAYPLNYMGIEVLNEESGDKFFVPNYCPLTRTSMVWDRKIGDTVFTFAASGLLYRENLVLYDIERRRLWSQMLIEKIYGGQDLRQPQTLHSFESTFGIIKTHYPNAKVYNGVFNSSARKTEQADHKDADPGDDDISTPLYSPGDNVYGVIQDDYVITISHNDLPNGLSIITKDNIVIVSYGEMGVIVSFINNSGLSLVENEFPTILRDAQGIKYDIFGKPVNLTGTANLESPNAYNALWWAWDSFYDDFDPVE